MHSKMHMKSYDWAINTDLRLKGKDMLQIHQMTLSYNSDKFSEKRRNSRKLFQSTHINH